MSIASSCQEGSACCTNQLAYRVTPCDDDAFWIRVILWWWWYILQFQCVLQVGRIQQFGKYTFLFFLSFPCRSSWIASNAFFYLDTNVFCKLDKYILQFGKYNFLLFLSPAFPCRSTWTFAWTAYKVVHVYDQLCAKGCSQCCPGYFALTNFTFFLSLIMAFLLLRIWRISNCVKKTEMPHMW